MELATTLEKLVEKVRMSCQAWPITKISKVTNIGPGSIDRFRKNEGVRVATLLKLCRFCDQHGYAPEGDDDSEQETLLERTNRRINQQLEKPLHIQDTHLNETENEPN